MTTRRTMLHALAGALLPSTLLPTTLVHAAAPAQESLKDVAHRKGFRFGTAIGAGPAQFGNPAYRALVERECGLIVAENEMKWQAVEAAAGAPNYKAADAMLGWAADKGIAVRGHNLFWQEEKWLPAWVAKADFGADRRAGAEALMRKHVSEVCKHFGSEVKSWDVVNEAVNPADGSLVQNTLTRALGATEQIDLAFRLARESSPRAELVYNDYMGPTQDSARHRAGVLKLLAELKKRGTPVDVLGLQSHIGPSKDSSALARQDLQEWRRFLDEARGMGFRLLITELDVGDRKLPADIAKRDAAVAAITRDYLDVTLSYPGLRDIVVWGMADNISWLQGWKDAKRQDGLPGRPCPYDAELKAKPMREAIAAAMAAAPARA
jgi:endo-1,4-beta-xylanase